MEYGPLAACIYVPVTQRYATLHEMQTVYSLEDAVTLWEVIRLADHNARLWSELK